jgi:CubicO group peptidase (beta-lactamase class C family)
MKQVCVGGLVAYAGLAIARRLFHFLDGKNGDVVELTLLIGVLFLFLTDGNGPSRRSREADKAVDVNESSETATSNLGHREKKAAVIRGWLDAWVAGGSIPHGIVSIHEKGKEVFFHASGYANAARKQLCDRNTVFRIYSMTKPITCIAVLMLQERGLLSVNDTIDKFLPEFADLQVYEDGTTEEDMKTSPASRKVTIQDLLTHTSGISYAFLTDHLCGRLLSKRVPNNDAVHFFMNTPIAELSRCTAATPLCFQPGSKWLYGLNTDLLGYIVELLSGRRLDQFFETEIFAPLGMKSTGFVVSPENLSNLADCFEVSAGHCMKASVAPERDRSSLKTMLAGGGGLVSTADDYQLFATMLARQGSYFDRNGKPRQLVKASTVQAMRRNYLPEGTDLATYGFDRGFSETVGAGYGFGYGVSVVIDPPNVPGGSLSPVGEFGWGGIASTAFYVDPVNEITLVFMTQLIPSKAYPLRAQLKWLSHWLCRDDLDDSTEAMKLL